MSNPLIYALRMRHIRASVAALLSFLCFRHFGHTLTINQISMNLITNTQLHDSEPNSRRCSRHLSRMSSDVIINPMIASPKLDYTRGHDGGSTKNPRRSASVVAVSTRNGSFQGHPNSMKNFRPMKPCTENDEINPLVDKRNI